MYLSFLQKISASFARFKRKVPPEENGDTTKRDSRSVGTKKISALCSSRAFKHFDRLKRWKLVEEATHEVTSDSVKEKKEE